MTPSPQKIESPDTPGGFTKHLLKVGQRHSFACIKSMSRFLLRIYVIAVPEEE